MLRLKVGRSSFLAAAFPTSRQRVVPSALRSARERSVWGKRVALGGCPVTKQTHTTNIETQELAT